MGSDLPDEVDRLYCVPLEQFVAERTALTKALRSEGRRDEAAAVAKLPKPALAAWAANQVVRSRPEAARALWQAGDAVLGVQDRAVAGDATGAQLREAIAAQREALAPLAEAARGMLTARGSFLGEQAVQSVIETLHAAAVDRAARPEVEAGRLARPLRLSGLGAMPAAPPVRRRSADAPAEEEAPAEEATEEPAPAPAGPPPSDTRAERARAKERARAERAVARAERARDAVAGRAARLRAELAEAEAELARLEDDVGAAREELEE